MNDKNIAALCLLETSKNPVEILLNLSKSLDCPVHNPVHHILVGSALLTAYKNAGGDIDLEKALDEKGYFIRIDLLSDEENLINQERKYRGLAPLSKEELDDMFK